MLGSAPPVMTLNYLISVSNVEDSLHLDLPTPVPVVLEPVSIIELVVIKSEVTNVEQVATVIVVNSEDEPEKVKPTVTLFIAFAILIVPRVESAGDLN